MEPDPAQLLVTGFDALPMQAALLDGAGEIVYTNEAWSEFGRENDFKGNPEGVGTNYLDVCEDDSDPDARRAAEGLHAVLTDERETFSFEYPCRVHGNDRWFSMLATGFEHERDRYVLVLHLDVTDRRRAETEARDRAERLERVTRLLSHDLRNPLAVALGYGEMVAADHPDDDRLSRTLSALRRMETLIEEVLAFARQGETGELTLVDLRTEAEAAWTNVPTEDATLTVVEDAMFEADSDLLAHVFENLYRNAVQHAGPEAAVRVGTTDDGFYVEDDGPGFPAEIRGNELAPEWLEREDRPGFGLGIVASIADAHDWTVRATAAEDGGARVEFRGVDLDTEDDDPASEASTTERE